jgi:hypothetical protein
MEIYELFDDTKFILRDNSQTELFLNIKTILDRLYREGKSSL